MMDWAEAEKELIKTIKDVAKAKSLMQMLKQREEALGMLDAERFTSVIVEGYYEVIKEAMTALMALDSYKTMSHEALVAYLKHFYKEFSEYEISIIDELRKTRNRVNYNGFHVKMDYLDRNKRMFLGIINKLKAVLEERLK